MLFRFATLLCIPIWCVDSVSKPVYSFSVIFLYITSGRKPSAGLFFISVGMVKQCAAVFWWSFFPLHRYKLRYSAYKFIMSHQWSTFLFLRSKAHSFAANSQKTAKHSFDFCLVLWYIPLNSVSGFFSNWLKASYRLSVSEWIPLSIISYYLYMIYQNSIDFCIRLLYNSSQKTGHIHPVVLQIKEKR